MRAFWKGLAGELLFLSLSVCLVGGIVVRGELAKASGLDVQLKDLRNSYYYLLSSKEKPSAKKNCKKLVAKEIRAFGRLIHCDPEEAHVVCTLKNGEKLHAFEAEAACEKDFSMR